LIGYEVVFGMMGVFMLISLGMLARVDVHAFRRDNAHPSVVERAAMAGDA
jgi:hypothetical protein